MTIPTWIKLSLLMQFLFIKSQGSEYPVVVIPIMIQHYILLQRNLIYTGITRGRKLVIIVGTKKALAIGVKNDKIQKRYTYLRHRLGG